MRERLLDRLVLCQEREISCPDCPSAGAGRGERYEERPRAPLQRYVNDQSLLPRKLIGVTRMIAIA